MRSQGKGKEQEYSNNLTLASFSAWWLLTVILGITTQETDGGGFLKA